MNLMVKIVPRFCGPTGIKHGLSSKIVDFSVDPKSCTSKVEWEVWDHHPHTAKVHEIVHPFTSVTFCDNQVQLHDQWGHGLTLSLEITT